MGALRDLIFGPEPGPVVRAAGAAETSQPPGLPPELGAMISEAVGARMGSFTIQQALQMPAVARGVQIIASTVASFTPLSYRDGIAMADQPIILRRPSPFQTRQEFLYQIAYSLLAGDETGRGAGDAFVLVTERDVDRIPVRCALLPTGEVQVEADRTGFLPAYTWRGQTFHPPDLIHIRIGRPPGALRGRSPIVVGLTALAAIAMAEIYAAAWFETGGVPSVVLKTLKQLDAVEAGALKAQWMTAHAGPGATPAVVDSDTTVEYPTNDPQSAQLQQARAYGATVVARLLGIPPPLLIIETSGSTITYGNASDAYDELVRTTVAPTYLAAIEAALSDLVPRTQAVRFDTRELLRTDVSTRFGLYQTGIAMGLFGAEDARAFEGWSRTGPIAGSLFAPVPAPRVPDVERIPTP